MFVICFQMEVTSSDQGIPKKSAKVTVQVNVRRNQFSPKFVQNRYNVTVDSRDIAGTLILTITATDGDADKQPQVKQYDQDLNQSHKMCFKTNICLSREKFS